jgi:hypothetical protein
MAAEIPDGVLAYKSRHKPVPLSELEKLLVVTACGGNTGWHHMIYRAKRYAPHLSNYSGAAGGRSFPSAAGFHTSNTFFTDDEWSGAISTPPMPLDIARRYLPPAICWAFPTRHVSRISSANGFIFSKIAKRTIVPLGGSSPRAIAMSIASSSTGTTFYASLPRSNSRRRPPPISDISLAVIHKVAESPAPARHSSSSKLVNNCAAGEILAGGRPASARSRSPRSYRKTVSSEPIGRFVL